MCSLDKASDISLITNILFYVDNLLMGVALFIAGGSTVWTRKSISVIDVYCANSEMPA